MKKIRFKNTFEEIMKVNVDNPESFYQSWIEYIGNIDPRYQEPVLEAIKKYDFEGFIFPMVTNVLKEHDRIKKAMEHVDKAVDHLSVSFEQYEKEVEVEVYFHLGLYSGIGEVVNIKGTPTILLGLEKIFDVHWDSYETLYSFIAHELGHIIQMQLRNDYTEHYTELSSYSAFHLFTEGFAEYGFGLLSPYPNARGEEWHRHCVKNLNKYKKEFLAYFLNDMSTDPFFGGTGKITEFSDSGYFLGGAFVEYLRRSKSFVETATLPIEKIKQELTVFLKQ